MKVAFVSQPWEVINPPFIGGSSVATITYRLAQQLRPSSEIVIYSKSRDGLPFSDYDEQGILFRRIAANAEEAYFKPFILGDRIASFFWQRQPLVGSSHYFRRYAGQVAEDIRRQQCDVVHIQNFSQFAPIIRALNPDVKIVLHMHCEWLTQLDRRTLEQRLRDVDLVIGCSDFITDGARARFPEFKGRWATIYNGVTVPAPRRDGAPPRTVSPKRLLYVGRLSPEKGVHVLLEAFNKVVDRHADVHLDVIGPPGLLAYNFLVGLSDDAITRTLQSFYGTSLVEKIRKQLVERGAGYMAYLRSCLTEAAASNVTFHGYIPHGERLDGFFRLADLFVLPSVCNEAFGMTPAEAMAFGVPSVVTRSGGVVEVVEEGVTGLMIDRNDAGAMAEGIVRLLEDEPLRLKMGKAGLVRARTLFAWDEVAARLLQQYQLLHNLPVESPAMSPSSDRFS